MLLDCSYNSLTAKDQSCVVYSTPLHCLLHTKSAGVIKTL